MQGKIIKGVGGFYYVDAQDGNVYECRAKGIFRKDKIKPLVGDNVEMTVLDGAEKKGNVDALLPRRNVLIRPAVANVDQALVVFAAASPKPNLNLLDRFLISMRKQDIPVIICFNKEDISGTSQMAHLKDIYKNCGCQTLFISVKNQMGLEAVREALCGKTTVLAGPSGVGKSSLMNYLYPEAQMETGTVSEKIKRGRHTTRHSEIFYIGDQSYLVDTPGFTSLYIQNMEKDELKNYFFEFEPYEGGCRFHGCVHVHEPDCKIKAALADGKISSHRYESYVQLYEELKEQRRY